MLDTPEDLRRVESLVDRCVAANPSAKAGVIMALYDLFARQAKVPYGRFWRLHRQRMPPFDRRDDDEAAESAAGAARAAGSPYQGQVGANDR